MYITGEKHVNTQIRPHRFGGEGVLIGGKQQLLFPPSNCCCYLWGWHDYIEEWPGTVVRSVEVCQLNFLSNLIRPCCGFVDKNVKMMLLRSSAVCVRSNLEIHHRRSYHKMLENSAANCRNTWQIVAARNCQDICQNMSSNM